MSERSLSMENDPIPYGKLGIAVGLAAVGAFAMNGGGRILALADEEETPAPHSETPAVVYELEEEPLPELSHIVEPGDSLGAIALVFDVELECLVWHNDIPDANKLDVGQIIAIPDTEIDSLEEIELIDYNKETQFGTELYAFQYALREAESSHDYTIWSSLDNGEYGHAKGAYQFIDETWQRALARHFPSLSCQYSQADQAPAAVQDQVALAEFARMYEEYQDWFVVAIAWHAGEGTANRYAAGEVSVLDNLSDGLMDTADYAQKITDRAKEVEASPPDEDNIEAVLSAQA